MKRLLLVLLVLVMILTNVFTFVSCDTHGHDHETESSTTVNKPTSPTDKEPVGQTTEKNDGSESEKTTQAPVSDTESETKTETKKEETETESSLVTESDTVISAPAESETDTETEETTKKETESESSSVTESEIPTEAPSPTEPESDEVTEPVTQAPTETKTEAPTETDDGAATENNGTEPCEHVFGEWVTTVKPTCTSDGSSERTCNKCGEKETDTVAKTNHKGGKATCTALAICEVCSKPYGDYAEHKWTDATCTSPKSCANCSATEGDALGHKGGKATCTKLAFCETCSQPYGALADHVWLDATCTEAQKCKNCSATKGDPLNHEGGTATCTTLANCERCGNPHGVLADHQWIDADCDAPRHCENCDAVEGEALEHKGGTATCTELAKCDECGKPYGELADHEWKDATCTDPKRCKNCSAFEGKPAGHTGGNATCTSLAICETCKLPYGELAGHEWIDATCTYPKHCDNCSATVGEALGHKGGKATCTALAVCETCGKGYGSYLPHVFNCQNTDPIYIVSEADCDNAAVYHYSCVCGLKGEETFTYGSPLGHNYTYISNGDGTHTYVCANDETHTGSEDCSGGEATCIDKAVCDFCKEEYGEPKGHDWSLGGVPLSDGSDGTVCTTPVKTNYYCPDCGETKVEITPAPGHKYTDTVVLPTCAEKGYTSHVCSKCGDNYIDNETEPTGEHSWDKELSCTSAHTCTVCSTVEAALGHSHKLIKSTEATCTSPATETYKCERCDDSYVVVISDALGHNIEKVTPTEEDIGNCLFVQHYECIRCKADVVGETVEHHTYVASIVKEATCQNKGTKKYVCSDCTHSYEEAIPSDPANHVWDDGVAAEGKIVYTCTENGCGQTKSVLDASDKDEADVNVSDLASGGIEFNEATLDVSGLTGSDGVLSGADNVTLSAGTLKGELLDAVKNNLTDKEKEQLGNNPIFNFTITSGDEQITNFGSDFVTVTIPYTLSEGEDVDSIAVWYMSGTELVSIEATYNNGFVTFVTNHFSYYTVTRLTPKQRCSLYGCVESEMTVAPTCTSDGYTLVVCVRCANSYQKDTVAALGHDYTSETHNPDCTNAGKTIYTCKTCRYSYEDAIPATGHTYTTTTTPSTCSEYGTIIGLCACGDSYTELIPKLPHSFKDRVVDPTCDKDGYTLHECTNDSCDYSYTDSTVSATGHKLKDSWSWSDDHSTATVTLECQKGCGFIHSEEIEATVRNTESTCLKNGKTEYTTKYVYNGVTYSDSYTVKKNVSDHDYETVWKHNKDGHWHKCRYCSGQSERFPHEFNISVVTKAPTCVSEGVLTKACVCGETVTETIPVSAEHRYVNRICIDCGAEEPCTHKFDGGLITTEPTCKEEGVKTYTCFICGETKEEKVPTNDHHTYEEGTVTVEPTCMGEGEMTYTCIWCGATHTETIDSLKGHIFGEGQIIYEPSCTYTGYIEYTCERCGEKKGELIPSLGGHVYDEGKTEREPECLKDGLVVYTCKNCGETKSKVIPSLGGHEFDEGKTEREPGCEKEGLFVYTCEVCGETKTETIPSLGGHKFDEGKVKYEPTCENDGLFVYTCEVCGETKTEAIPSLGGHKFDQGKVTKEPTCVEGGIKTFTCERCGETKTETIASLGGHKYDGGKVTKEPTCTDSGIMTYTCTECGQTKTEKISATGEHHYVGGVCDKCGHVNGECDHTEFTEIVIDLSEYGACGGMLYGMTCSCGEVVIADIDRFNTEKCEFELVDQKQTANEDGTATMYVKTRCTKCSLEAETIIVAQRTTECTIEMNYTLNVLIGDTFVVDGWICTITEEAHTSAGMQTIDLTEYTPCGGTVTTFVCNGCGEVLELESIDLNCKGEFIYSEMTDEDGILHDIVTMVCVECGMTVISDSCNIFMGDCSYEEITTVTFIVNGNEVFKNTSTYYFTEHNYKTEYVLHGDTCSDGYTVRETCTVCELTREHEDSGHHTSNEFIELDVCGGGVYLDRCEICKQIISVSDIVCKPENYETSEEVGKDGIIHQISSFVCAECGVEYRLDYWSIDVNECVYKTSKTITYSKNGEILLNVEIINVEENHSYENEYILNGESCHDGVTVNSTCTTCGDTYTETMHGHITFENHYDLKEIGGCDGWIKVTACPCGEIGNLDWNFFNGDSVSSHTYTDPDGILHTVNTYTCSCKNRCTTIVADWFCAGADGCYEIIRWTYSVTVNGEEIVSGINATSHKSSHTYGEGKITLMGETCKDGVSVYYTCTKCGSGHGTTYYYHEIVKYNDVSLSEYGVCENHFFSVGSCACGAETELISDLLNNDAESGACEKCSLEMISNRDVAENGCSYTEFTSVIAKIGNETVELYSSTVSYVNHSYSAEFVKSSNGDLEVKVTCESCGDSKIKKAEPEEYCPHSDEYTVTFALLLSEGDSCINGVQIGHLCSMCGNIRSIDMAYHHVQVNKTVFSSPDCSCHVFEYTCPCGQESGINTSFSSTIGSEWFSYYDENGFWHNGTVTVCNDCGLTAKDEYYEVREGCEMVSYDAYTVTYNGETVAKSKREQNRYESHDFQYEYTMLGKSCTDGIIVRELCTNCKLSSGYEEEAYYHYFTNGKSIDFFEIGACSNHHYYTNVCLCGQQRSSGSNIYDELEYDRALGGYVCHDCGMVLKEVSNESHESCKTTSSFEVQVSVNGKDHVFMQRSETVDDHSFTLNVSKDESGSLTITRTCADCGVSYVTTPDNALLTDHDGEIYFDIEVTPDKDTTYILTTFAERGIYVSLYRIENGEWISELETGIGHYPIFHDLKAGNTYVFRIGAQWGYEEFTVPYTFGIYDDSCMHEKTTFLSQFATENKNCNDGVYATEICNACGSIVSYRYITYHDSHHVETIDLYALGGCRGTYLYFYACPCGQEKHFELSYSCSIECTEESYTDEFGFTHNTYTDRCTSCGLTYVKEEYMSYDGCVTYSNTDYTVTLNGETVALQESFYVYSEDHDLERRYRLNGDSCDDGYYVYYVCTKCGYETEGSEENFGHGMYWDHISLDELGSCGGYIEIMSCACGQHTNISWGLNCGYTSESERTTDELGRVHRINTHSCADCGTVIVEDTFEDSDTCCRYSYTVFTATVGDTEVVSGYTLTDILESNHDYAYEFTMNGESCTDGYTAIATCEKCGYTYTDIAQDHYTYVVKRYDISELGGCEGTVDIISCACGQNKRVDYNPCCSFEGFGDAVTGDDGIIHNVTENRCVNCGLVIVTDSYDVKNGCFITNYNTVTVTFGENVLADNVTFENAMREDHDMSVGYSLSGESCEDGITYFYSCSVCDYSFTEETFWHYNVITERYELSEYGACGGYVEISNCPCGESNEIDTAIYYCPYSIETQRYADSDGNIHTVRHYWCEECGLEVTDDEYGIKTGCIKNIYRAVTVKVGETKVVSTDFLHTHDSIDHNISYEFITHGDSCYEGYEVYETCSGCDYKEYYTGSYHNTYVIEKHNVSKFGACGGEISINSCACGYDQSVEFYDLVCKLESETVYSGESGFEHKITTYTCTECGLKIYSELYEEQTGCLIFTYCKYSAVMGDSEIFNHSYVSSSRESHEYAITFELHGDSCTDGYTVYETCTRCGASYSYEQAEHTSFLSEEIDPAEVGACEGRITVYSCPCGEYKRLETDMSCSFDYNYDDFTDENKVYHEITTSTCADCGLVYVRDTTSIRELEECLRVEYTYFSMTLGDNEIFLPFTSRTAVRKEHEIQTSFTLNGDTCLEGYRMTRTCQYCDYCWEDEGYDHYSYNITSLSLGELGYCGGSLELQSCACGENVYVYWYLECEYESNNYEETDENGVTYNVNEAYCNECGIKVIRRSYTVTDVCYDYARELFSALHGEEVLIPEVDRLVTIYEHHSSESSFVLDGESCEDGMTITSTCKNCGNVSEERAYHHYMLPYQTVELSECGGCVNINRCPCEERIRFSYEMGCFSYTTDHSNYVDESGNTHSVETSECMTCGLVLTIDSYSEKTDCIVRSYRTLTAQVDGKITAGPVTELYSSYTAHNYEVTFGSEVDNCEDGVEIINTCTDCGEWYSYTTYSHSTFTLETYDLTSFGACRGTVTLSSCACGEAMHCNDSRICGKYTSNKYYDDEGRLVNTSGYSCDECGLRLSHSYYTVKDSENCILTYFHTYIVTVGSRLVCNLTYNTYEASHDYAYEGVLDEGAFDCTDGVTVIGKCRDCDHTETNHYYHHSQFVKETYAPENVCGGTINIFECACGSNVSISDINSLLCDFDYKTTEPWIDGALADGYYETESYGIHLYSNYGVYTCAVTDPHQCAYKIRYAYYYIYVDGCVVQRHETYWFGYDEETGTYDKEITIAYDTKYVIHSYTHENVHKTYSDGSYMDGTESVCKCGTTKYTYNYYNADHNHIKHEYEFSCPTVNSAINESYVKIVEEYLGIYHERLGNLTVFRSEERHYYDGYKHLESNVYEYDLNYDSGFGIFSYVQKTTTTENGNISYREIARTEYERHWFINYEYEKHYVGTADEYWTRYDHTYNFEGSCTCTTHITSSNGEDHTYLSEAHPTWHYDIIKAPTCTQYGTEGRFCPLCKSIFDEYEIEPTAHYWNYIGNGLYRCSDCGLENINGASGEIVMEDLTSEYGGGKNYVVGYWNRGDVEYLCYVSAVLHTPMADGNDEVILTGIEFVELEEVRAISFSFEAVYEAVLLALDGLGPDGYDVRFTFVPKGSDGSFDYAITFTDN